MRFGVAGDDDLVGNRVSARWRGSVRSGEEVEVLGWIGPVSVSEPDGLLLVGVAGKEDDFLVDDVVLGGIARLGVAENWGIDRWWRTTNGAACDLIFAVVRTPDEASRAGVPGAAGRPGRRSGPGRRRNRTTTWPCSVERRRRIRTSPAGPSRPRFPRPRIVKWGERDCGGDAAAAPCPGRAEPFGGPGQRGRSGA